MASQRLYRALCVSPALPQGRHASPGEGPGRRFSFDSPGSSSPVVGSAGAGPTAAQPVWALNPLTHLGEDFNGFVVAQPLAVRSKKHFERTANVRLLGTPLLDDWPNVHVQQGTWIGNAYPYSFK